MNLGRVGHYFVPSGSTETLDRVVQTEGGGQAQNVPLTVLTGACRTAIVTGHEGYGGARQDTVHLIAFRHGGEILDSKQDVPIALPIPNGTGVEAASFHLSADCPWKR